MISIQKIQTTNELEEEILDKFKILVKDLKQDEPTLIRFLMARDYHLKNAEIMLRETIKWRKSMDMDSLLSENFEYLRTELPYRFTGFDYHGGPVLWVRFGYFNHRPWVEQGHSEVMFRYAVRIIEEGLKFVNSTPGGRLQATVIFGLEHLSYYQGAHIASLKLLRNVFRSLEQYFPELLGRLVIVNAPWIFSIPFSFMKTIISAHSLTKITIFDSNKKKWLPHLLEIAPRKCLPSEYFEDQNGN